MVLIVTSENEPEKCMFNESVCGAIETSHSMHLPSQVNAVSCGIEAEAGPMYLGMEQGSRYAQTTNHDYMHRGYNDACHQWEDQSYFFPQERSAMPHSVENDAFGYCMPSHVSHAPGQVTSFENQSSFQQPSFSASGFQQNIATLSESMPVCSWDSRRGPENAVLKLKMTKISEMKASSSGDAGLSNSEDLKSGNSGIELENKTSPKLLELKMHQFTSSGFSGHPVRPFKAPEMRPGIQPIRFSQGFHHSMKLPSSSYQGQSFPFARNTFSGSRSVCSTVNNNYRFQMREKPSFHRSYGTPNELVRGPRSTNRGKPYSSSSGEKVGLVSHIRREDYNKLEFQVNYEHAKFFMIKSYSEDDIHKSIKYNVWASTPNGNNKLDAAFRKAEAEKLEKGIPCPIFLFFSVNASGQFVGLAEMIGPVDFKKSMDFWQQDKWNGFFPVKWHIIKDIPNKNFLHITLENNDNKAVTFSRDTQEIRLPQGLCMLKIFKAYHPSGTSMLDDFEFYEEKEKEKPLPASTSNQSAVRASNVDSVDDSSMKHLESSFGNMSMSASSRKSQPASKSFTGNFTGRLSVNGRLPMQRS